MLIFKKIGLIALTALSAIYTVGISCYHIYNVTQIFKGCKYLSSIGVYDTLFIFKSAARALALEFVHHGLSCICAIILFIISLKFTIRFYKDNPGEKVRKNFKELVERNKQIKRQKKIDRLKSKIESMERGE